MIRYFHPPAQQHRKGGGAVGHVIGLDLDQQPMPSGQGELARGVRLLEVDLAPGEGSFPA